MKKHRDIIFGFFFFFLTSGFCTSISILVYSFIDNKEKYEIAIWMLLLIIFIALIFTICDFIRRKIMINKPLDEIIKATNNMANGKFDIVLIPNHSYDDFDEFDLIKEALNNINKELSKRKLLNDDFIANFSHEIKTPINVIQNYSKALKTKGLSEEDRNKYIEALNISCKKLSDLVNSILKLNKLESQKLNPEFKMFNLSESIIEQIIQFESLIDEKNIELICDIEENLMINSEEGYLELIWNNLISNAIKFNKENGTIKIKLNKENEDYIFKISDTGIGMSTETGSRIFEKFYQGDTSHSSLGNGLGLALVKKVVDLLGGSIKVESEVNVGTTFVVTIRSNYER